MNRSHMICAAALVLAACAEPTSPTAVSDLTPSYARKPSGPTQSVVGNLQNNTFRFAAGDYAMEGSTSTSLEVQDQNSAGVSSVMTEAMPSAPTNYVLGRLSNQQVVIGINPGAVEYQLTLDFYAIGSWDGRGQQAQHGAFGQDSWQVSALCGTEVVDVFTTSFSNQKSVQQHYPSSISGKPSQWLTKSSGTNVTGFSAIVPLFQSVVDSHYQLTFTGANPCGSLPFTAIRLSIPGFDLQGRSDEAWAVDNLTIKTDSN